MFGFVPQWIWLKEPQFEGKLPVQKAERRKLAWRGAAKSPLSRTDALELQALGRDAMPAILFVCRNAKGARRYEAENLLVKIAEVGDTATILTLYKAHEPLPSQGGFIDFYGPYLLEKWLKDEGEGNLVATYFFPLFEKANEVGRENLLPCILRSSDPKIVDALFKILKGPSKKIYWKAQIYETIASSQRPDVLSWLRSQRRTWRTLSKPDPDLSTTLDSDGDGLIDAWDVNSKAAPRRLTEEEQVLCVSFEAMNHFSKANGKRTIVHFPNGIRPFELFGSDGAIIPEGDVLDKPPVLDRQSRFFNVNSFGWSDERGPVVRFGKDLATAVVGCYSGSGPLAGGGYRVRLRKIEGVWYVVQATVTFMA